MSQKYIVDKGWQILMNDMGVSPQDVLRQAQMPLDLLTRKSPTVTADEYFRFWDGLAHVLRDEPTFPIRLVEAMSTEAFSPPMFASFCSADLNQALKRIAHYKPLVGPLRLDVQVRSDATSVAFSGLPGNRQPPKMLIAVELVYWVRIARMALRERVVPLSVHTTIKLDDQAAYEQYLGVPITPDTFNGIRFSAADAVKPFLTANDAMWSMFEPSLNLRMQDLEQNARFRDRVRACLMEIMASGHYSMADVASRLAVSTRTMQRRLRDEGTSFQKELDALREELARNYLSRSDYSGGQIAFLLGYEDPNSFYRAFRTWTGQTPEVVRAQLQ